MEISAITKVKSIKNKKVLEPKTSDIAPISPLIIADMPPSFKANATNKGIAANICQTINTPSIPIIYLQLSLRPLYACSIYINS